MTDPTPTADDVARWERLADVHIQCATITGFMPQCRCGSMWPCATGEALDGLLALVAAQAAELAALHATDDYQRWARAVAERDAAREQVARVRALCDEEERTRRGITINGDKFPALVATTDVRAALDGEAAT